MYKNFVVKNFAKNFLAFAVSIFLISCASKSATDKSPDKAKVEENVAQAVTAPEAVAKPQYETVESEGQADAVNKQSADAQNEVEVQDRVFFASNSSTLDEEAKKILDVQSEWLKSDESIKITIEGHCDERGPREYNIALGEKRAFAVKKYLKQKGISESRVKVVSYGKERLAFIGNSDEIHSKNRRAVTVVNQ